ncbi:MAG: hypothetical protein Q9162_001700 [Coniocarpon cinnabarinum]
MKSTVAVITTLFAYTALAAPTATLNKRADQVQCGQYTTITASPKYLLETNLWGQGGYTGNGNGQCDTLVSASGDNIAWNTNWTWSGGSSSVKSYTNVQLQMQPVALSSISTIPTTWKWSQTGSNVVADVSYDLFTSSSAGGANENEIMVWLAAFGGAGPIGGGSSVASFTNGGVTFNLYKGENTATNNMVYSFVATSPAENFTGDLNAFLKFLTSGQGLSGSQYLKSLQAGTEPFTGSNVELQTSSYSVTLNA